MPTALLPSLSLLKGTGGSRSMVYSCHTSLILPSLCLRIFIQSTFLTLDSPRHCV